MKKITIAALAFAAVLAFCVPAAAETYCPGKEDDD